MAVKTKTTEDILLVFSGGEEAFKDPKRENGEVIAEIPGEWRKHR